MRILCTILLIASGLYPIGDRGSVPPDLLRPTLVDRFYRQRQGQLFWFGADGAERRQQLLACIDSAAWSGLDSDRYHAGALRLLVDRGGGDSQGRLMTYDRQYTDAALALAADVFRGADIGKAISYDGVSAAYAERDDDVLLAGLLNSGVVGVGQGLRRFEPVSAEYSKLKKTLRTYTDSGDVKRMARLSAAMNIYRWIHHFSFDRFLVVNIPSATLRYYAGDTVNLRMRVVAGQPSKRTPRFAAWVDGLVLYPYWNIPRKIATHELLPLFQKSPGMASYMEIQVLDGRGKPVDPEKVDWAAYSVTDFPFTLRQAPGCQNALGVLKFDISSPFDVYMHDTNLKRAFASSWRYLSHGCIRLEKPTILGEILLDNRLDTAILNACLRNQRPVPIPLRPHVPVFVVYNTVETAPDGSLTWLKDVYHLLP